ncbi:hypothetical protein HDV00_004853, partial [Rhizophlyctis rosea]
DLSGVTGIAGPLPAGLFTSLPGLTTLTLTGQDGITGPLPAIPAARTNPVTLNLGGSGITQIPATSLAQVGGCTPSTGLCASGATVVPANVCGITLACSATSSTTTSTTRSGASAGPAATPPSGTDIVAAPIPAAAIISSISASLLGTPSPSPSTIPWNGLPENSFAIESGNNIRWYALIGILGASLIILLSLLIVSWRQKSGRLSRAATLKRSLSRRGQGDELAHLNPALLAPGVRNHSLPDNRSANNDDALANAKEFISANGGKDEFPVVRAHSKTASDELSLVSGDKVVLTRAFADGWAEGVSRRAGGPAVFPISCLGGSVPGILVRRYEQQVGMMGGGYGYQQAGYGQQGAGGYGVHQRGGY